MMSNEEVALAVETAASDIANVISAANGELLVALAIIIVLLGLILWRVW